MINEKFEKCFHLVAQIVLLFFKAVHAQYFFRPAIHLRRSGHG